MKLKNLPLVLLFASVGALAEPGSVTRNTDLKDKPFLDATTTVQLSAGSAVDIQKRQGAWMQVKTREGKTGWVKLLNIRSGAAASGSVLGLASIGQLANVAKTGSSGNTVTTGVKGLSAEQMMNARANPEELARLQNLSVSSTDAHKYATQAKLTAQKIPAIETAQ